MRSETARHQLISAAQSGDPAALARLLKECHPDARRYAQLHCHASNVDDAIQEALLIVSRKIHAIKVVAAFSSWLFTIIKRECKKLFAVVLPYELDDADRRQDYFSATNEEGIRLDLIAALESLPPHYLTVILLRDFEEMTIAEISNHLNENIAAVKSRLHRAREMVREYLTPQK